MAEAGGFLGCRRIGLCAALMVRVGQERSIIDKKTGQERKISAEAKLLFIPARYWPVVLIVLGLVFLFYNPQGDA